MVPLGAMCFGGRFHAGGKGGSGEVGWFTCGAVVSHLCINGLETFFSPCRGSISSIVGRFRSRRLFAGWRAQTIDSSVVNRCS